MSTESWERIYWMRKVEQVEREIERLREEQREYRKAAQMANARFTEDYYAEA